MKSYPDICETCGRIGGYTVIIIHDRPERQRPRNEHICGNCFADRLESWSPANKTRVADLRQKDKEMLGEVVNS